MAEQMSLAGAATTATPAPTLAEAVATPAAETTATALAVETAQSTATGAGAEPVQTTTDKTKPEPSGQAEATKPAAAELKLPEGVDEGLATVLKEAKTVQDAVNAFLKHDEQHEKSAQSEREALQATWVKQVEEDKEIGGKWLNERGEPNTKNPSVVAARKAITRFGTTGLAEILKSPIGSHPEVLRLLTRVGKALAEDSVSGTTANANGSGKPDFRLWFPGAELNP